MVANAIKCLLILSTIVFQVTTTSASSFSLNNKLRSNSVPEIITPTPKPQPRINGPLVYGSRPGHPFLYRIPCQGERPITFKIRNLPEGLKLDPATGIITGITPAKGEYKTTIIAHNSKGNDKREYRIISGDKLALTPPMGWNPGMLIMTASQTR